MADLRGVDAATDPTHGLLRAEIERPARGYLWTEADTITFVPHVLPVIYGDGRALFAIATINQRPAYWVIRGCSTWGCGYDSDDNRGPDFAEMTDEILTALEDAFGSGRCGYSGNSLFWPREERLENCSCEECDDEHVAEWPEVDGSGGCSWCRMDWPKTFETVPNPLSWQGNLLAVSGVLDRWADDGAPSLSMEG